MAFTSKTLEEIASIQGEPDWLRARRRTALTAFERLPMPSRTDEEWRRTDVTKLDPAVFSQFEHSNGFKQAETSLPAGVILESLATAAERHPELLEPALFSLVRADRDRFAALHAAFFTGGNFLYVPEGVVIEQPILRQHFSHSDGTAVLPHTVIVAGRGSKFYYLDEYIGQEGEGAGYRSGSAEIFVGEGAEVGYVAIQKWGRHAWHLADQRARLEKDSTLRLFNVTLGGRFSKTRVEASLVGQGANAELKGIYLASGEQFFDFHTLQDHQVGNTRSDLLFKGALQDTARAVYAGLIRIEKGAFRDPDARDRQQRCPMHARRHGRPGRPTEPVLPPVARDSRGDRQADDRPGLFRRGPRAHPIRAGAHIGRGRAGGEAWLRFASRPPQRSPSIR
jgi:Fe-S cluster assembly protein SufD